MTDEQLLFTYVAEYIARYFAGNSNIPQLSERHTAGDKGVKGAWEGTSQAAGPGVYVAFTAEGKALYIGKSSNNKTIGSRLVRFRYHGFPWENTPEYIRMISVSESYEAPSLEEFLISKIETSYNVVGRR